jgi:chemotaxis protein MotA
MAEPKPGADKAKADKTKATPAPGSTTTKSRIDLATLAGLLLATGGIVGGLILEGGNLGDITQYTAAIIVLGGTIGAVMVSTPLSGLLSATRRLGSVVVERNPPVDAIIDKVVNYATRARKNGIVSLEQEAEHEPDPFLNKALNLAVDGTDLQELRKMMELEIALDEHHAEADSKVYEAAGGYSPTIGIIGAVMGLIQVMKNLSDIDKVGHGIAVSFVATVYGVGIANIFFLPVATKIKARAHATTQIKELILEGVIGIVEGLNPKLIRMKLEAYSGEKAKMAAPGKDKSGAKNKAAKDKPDAKEAA